MNLVKLEVGECLGQALRAVALILVPLQCDLELLLLLPVSTHHDGVHAGLDGQEPLHPARGACLLTSLVH